MKKEQAKKTPQEFMDAYQALCREFGYQLNVIPVYRARDDGTFSTVLQITVSEMKEA